MNKKYIFIIIIQFISLIVYSQNYKGVENSSIYIQRESINGNNKIDLNVKLFRLKADTIGFYSIPQALILINGISYNYIASEEFYYIKNLDKINKFSILINGRIYKIDIHDLKRKGTTYYFTIYLV